jgi:hypothetical protein
MCPSKHAVAKSSRLVFSALMVVAWSGMPQYVIAAPPEPKVGADKLTAIADGFNQYAKFVAVIRSTVDRTTFDPQAVVDQVGTDPVKLASWVAENTRYVPYAGCLRGPVGVLMDRSGNDLDRALLLAKLLQLARVDARLAHGTLAEPQAKELLDRAASAPARPAAVVEDREKVIAQIAAANGLTAARVGEVIEAQELESEKAQEQLVNTVTDQSGRLTELLGNDVRLKEVAPVQNPADVWDHWWVQFHAGEKWIDADPQAPKDNAGQAYCAVMETLDLPEDWTQPLTARKLLHQVGIRVRIERMSAKGAEQFTVMDRSISPAQLAGKAMTFTLLPLRWPGGIDLLGAGGRQKLKETLLAQHAWLPMLLLNGTPTYDSSFDDQGKIDPKPTLDAMGQLAGTVKSKLSDALDALNDNAPAAPEQALTSVWVEYDIKAPNQPTQTIRRDVFDLFGPAQRKAGVPAGVPKLTELDNFRRSAALFRSIDLLPAGCVFAQGFVSSTAVSDFQRTTAVVRDALREAAAGSTGPAAMKIAQLQPQPIPLMALASLREGPSGLATGIIVDRPNLFAQQHSLIVRDDGSIGAINAIDILNTSVAVHAGPDGFVREVRQGVMETYLEGTLVGSGVENNTAAIYRASAAQNISWKLYKDAGDPSLAKGGLSETARSRIASDLAAGFVVIAPEKAVTFSNRSYEGWWRVDPKTGNTVGYMANGMGAAATEYSGVIYVIAWAAGIAAFIGCGGDDAVAQGNTYKALGCAVCGVIAGVLVYFGGLGANGYAGATAKWAAGSGGWAGGAGAGIACTGVGKM